MVDALTPVLVVVTPNDVVVELDELVDDVELVVVGVSLPSVPGVCRCSMWASAVWA